MKKTMISLLACALLLPALCAMAQEQGAPPQGEEQGEGPEGAPPMAKGEPKEHPMLAAPFVDMLTERLELSAEQKAKVQKAIAASKDGLTKKFAEAVKVRKEMQAVEKGLWDKIGATLNDDQKKILKRIERAQPGGPGGPGGPGMRRGGQGGMGPGGMGPGRRGQGQGPRGQGREERPQQPPQEAPGGEE